MISLKTGEIMKQLIIVCVHSVCVCKCGTSAYSGVDCIIHSNTILLYAQLMYVMCTSNGVLLSVGIIVG